MVRIKPEANHTSPQCVECVLDPFVTKLLKHNTVYSLHFPKEANRGQGPWDGGIPWWRRSSDATDSTLEYSNATARRYLRTSTSFKAMSNFPKPPRFEYTLRFTPAVVSLADHGETTLTVTVRLLETTNFTVAWRTLNGRTLLGPEHEQVSSFCFNLIDSETGKVLSGQPRHGNSQWDPYLHPNAKIKRDHVRELQPGQLCVTEAAITHPSRSLRHPLVNFFRVKDAESLVNRRLGIRLRRNYTYWSAKSIDELFAETDVVRPGQWYMPLVIESEVLAEFTLVP